MQTRSKKLYQRRRRSNSGQIEVFGAELAVGTLVVIGYFFFLINAGMAGYYKEKFGFVSGQAALFAAAYGGNKVDAATSAFVADLCNQMHLKVSGLDVNVQPSNLNGRQAYTCVVAGNFPLPFFQEGIFPSIIHTSDSATAAINNQGQSNGNNLTIFGSNNSVVNTNGIIPKGSIFGFFNNFYNVATVGNTAGLGNTNTSGNTLGVNNTNTSGNTFGFNNNNTVGDASNLDNLGAWTSVTDQPGIDTNGWTDVVNHP